MDFNDLLQLVGGDPVFESSLLLSGRINPKSVRLQLTRWVKSGRILQLRRGLYAIAPPYQKAQPHPFLVANHLQRASYVSLQSALSYYGLIPEVVHRTMSISTGRPEQLETPLGGFVFRHIKTAYFFGYQMADLGGGSSAQVAVPEKALLDLIYLQPGADSVEFIFELRLQNLERLDLAKLKTFSERFYTPRMSRASDRIIHLAAGNFGYYKEP